MRIRKLFPILLKKSSIPVTRWADVVHLACNLINQTPNESTNFPPAILMKGYLTNPLFEAYGLKCPLSDIWQEAAENSLKNRERQLHLPSINRGKKDSLPEGCKVFIFLGNKGERKVPAIVVHDYGVTALVRKLEGRNDRFREITVHKSRISRQVEEPLQCNFSYINLNL